LKGVGWGTYQSTRLLWISEEEKCGYWKTKGMSRCSVGNSGSAHCVLSVWDSSRDDGVVSYQVDDLVMPRRQEIAPVVVEGLEGLVAIRNWSTKRTHTTLSKS